jgi:hypothetical protein
MKKFLTAFAGIAAAFAACATTVPSAAQSVAFRSILLIPPSMTMLFKLKERLMRPFVVC